MRNHHAARSGILVLLLLAFIFVRAQSVTVTANVTGVCHSNDGSVTFTLTGGSGGGHTYAIYGPVSFNSQSSPTFTGLTIGNYQVMVGGSDSGYTSFNVGTLVNLTGTVTNTTCPLNQGSIAAIATGGAGGYGYLWNTSATTATISGLAGGIYYLTVTDANGCTGNLAKQVQATSSMTVGITNTGSVCAPVLTASATNSTGTVSYHWSDSSNTNAISGFSAYTNYTVTGTDANSCTASQSFNTGSNSLLIDSTNGGGVTVVNPGCATNNGSVTVHIRTGLAPYTWHWAGSSSVDSIASGLAPGYYSVTVTDANGCTGTNGYQLTAAGQVYVSINSVTNPSCGASDGSITVYGFGGSGSITYLWNNAATSTALSGLAAGTYSVTATASNSCSASASYTLVGQANYQVNISVTPTACDTSLHTGAATAVITGSGGTPPYNFTWYDNYYYPALLLGTSQTISGLHYQTQLSVVVTDANGCVPMANYDSASIQLDPSCFDHITGYIFNDANSNCTKDAGENGISGGFVRASGSGGSYWANADSTGYYDIEVIPGTYTTTFQVYNYGTCVGSVCTNHYTHTFTVIGQTSTGNNFGMDLSSQTFDLGVHTGCTVSSPGSTKGYWVYYYNHGIAPATGTVLTFTHDPNITLASTVPAYSAYNATTHVITWNLGSVTANGNWIQVYMTFDIPTTLTLGSYLTAVAEINPVAGDCNSVDNVESISDMVSGSHDPNEKEVSPAGNLTESDSVLHYTVRFQNDGNAPANLVVVKDTLSPNVDPGTVVPGASSHPYKFTMSGKGILTFTFEGINLPDSSFGESSKGFVNYTVHTKPNLPIGTQVHNTAYIYFDFNSAVVTNTTSNTRSDFNTGIKSVNEGGLTVTVSPNPVQDKSTLHITGATGAVNFDLMDVRGQKVMEKKTNDRDITLQSEMFAPGMYLYTVKDAAGKTQSGKILITR
ncbi:MAG: hypothetical protein JWO03_3692 [Bacteroidetes bacterium]|nr:hypothetical protein [Bacteroidota bacterium]